MKKGNPVKLNTVEIQGRVLRPRKVKADGNVPSKSQKSKPVTRRVKLKANVAEKVKSDSQINPAKDRAETSVDIRLGNIKIGTKILPKSATAPPGRLKRDVKKRESCSLPCCADSNKEAKNQNQKTVAKALKQEPAKISKESSRASNLKMTSPDACVPVRAQYVYGIDPKTGEEVIQGAIVPSIQVQQMQQFLRSNLTDKPPGSENSAISGTSNDIEDVSHVQVPPGDGWLTIVKSEQFGWIYSLCGQKYYMKDGREQCSLNETDDAV